MHPLGAVDRHHNPMQCPLDRRPCGVAGSRRCTVREPTGPAFARLRSPRVHIKVEKYTIAVDPGIIVNPAQLKRQVEGGAVMGISHALLEEATFDESGITVNDWNSYPILTMADVPEIKVVLINNPKVGSYGGGSEAANALAAPAIAAAVHDATGKVLRRIPLKPAYVQAALKA